jgi:hypothetical protein
MEADREHPLYHLDAETALVAIYVWVDDELKALGDRGFRWVAGVKTSPYRLRGGKVVETGWRGWIRVRNWIETRFGVMVDSLGLHRLSARSFG